MLLRLGRNCQGSHLLNFLNEEDAKASNRTQGHGLAEFDSPEELSNTTANQNGTPQDLVLGPFQKPRNHLNNWINYDTSLVPLLERGVSLEKVSVFVDH